LLRNIFTIGLIDKIMAVLFIKNHIKHSKRIMYIYIYFFYWASYDYIYILAYNVLERETKNWPQINNGVHLVPQHYLIYCYNVNNIDDISSPTRR
jgi:hypothetical protein